MGKAWIRLGCFLTGYNYKIIRDCSEASKKAVKKYLSAILIISLLWGFIGYAFTMRYLHGGVYACAIASAVMVFVVVQIERQIILSVGKNRLAAWFRVVIGILMAVIGSVILDQVMFKSDIENHNLQNIDLQVNELMPLETRQLREQIREKDSAIQAKEDEREATIKDVRRRPRIYTPTSTVTFVRDSTGRIISKRSSTTNSSVRNPEIDRIAPLNAQIDTLIRQKTVLENQTVNLRESIKRQLVSNVGFLDELKVLFHVLLSSWISLVVWLFIFLFFLSLELFVLANKLFGDTRNDYDQIVMHQLDIRIKMLGKLNEKSASYEVR